jgi:outer membrane protein OmpA-like peptidoglycan-associated protein
MKILALVLFTLTISVGYAQSGKLKKADNYYDKVAYAYAIPLYTELLESEVDSPEMKSKLANSYYQIGETQKAEEIYAMFIDKTNSKPEEIYNYAQSLKENGKYSDSDVWMAAFHTKTSDDLRAKEFAGNKSYLADLNNQAPYFSISHLAVNTKYSDFGGYPSKDDEVYFVSNRKKHVSVKRFHSFNDKKFLDLYVGNSVNNTIENPEFQAKKNKKYHEGPLCFNSDLTRVYFTRNNMSSGKNRRDEKGIQNLKIYFANVTTEGAWENEQEMEINSKAYSVGHPCLSVDGKTLYFASDMPGGFGGVDIYKMAVLEDGKFGLPVNLGNEINTEGQEMFPWMSAEGILFFSSDGHVGLGGLDIFAMVPDRNGNFKKRINAGTPVNSSRDDFALIMNADNTTGYLSSNRENGTGDDDIYSFQLLRPLKVNLMVQGVVADVRSGAILPGAEVQLLNEAGEVVATTTADTKGGYEFNVEPELDYSIAATKDDYFDNNTTFTTKDLDPKIELLKEDVTLEKDPGLSLYALVTDAKTGDVLEGVTIQITDNMTGGIETITTPASGDYLRPLIDKKLDDRGSYNLSISKEGFIPKTVTYNALFDKEGQYDVHADLDLSLDPMVSDLSELIEINPINFDLNKYKIRPDAATELDKIVEVMNKYPNMEVELGSHTDCRASKAYNEKLSDRRAKASAAYIKSKITNPERIYGKGYGESKLLNGCECEGAVKSDCSEEEHEKNRRTEFKVISVGDPNVGVQNNSTNSFEE